MSSPSVNPLQGRRPLRRLGLLLALAGALGACATPAPTEQGEGTVHHLVLCWLKHPDRQEDRRRLIEVSRSLALIPGVEALYVGSALPSDRDIVDDSFDVGLYFRFGSRQAMERYLQHRDHVRAVKEVIRPLTRQIRVHDFTTPH